MRIISACLIAVISTSIIFPGVARADELQSTNETKTKLNVQTVGVEKSDAVMENSQNALLSIDPNNFQNTVESPYRIDPERESLLARFKSDAKAKNLPQGKFTINASAYTAAADECGKSDGITASGLKVKEKETLACPSNFPFGTKIQIEGMGTYVCEDRGGAIRGNHIDIYVETKTQAFDFGRQHLQAKVVS